MTHPSLRCLAVIAVLGLPVLASADAPAGRYTIADGGNAKGTVYDKKTKLTWQQTVPSTTYDWDGAKAYCAQVGATLAGTGWRLPTLKELMSIVDYSRYDPAIDPTAFPSTPSDYFWSSSPLAGSSSSAWLVRFTVGYPDYVGNAAYVRCVR